MSHHGVMTDPLPSLLRRPWWLETHATCCARRLFSVPDLDWTVQADGYRLVIKDGAMTGLAYDEFPWLWGDPRYDDATIYSWMADGPFPDSAVLAPGALAAQPADEPPPGLPYRYFGMCDE
jgi:hypothetical protein